MNLRERVNQLLEGKGENYIFPFFWQHGESAEVLRGYMRKIHEANIGAVCVESRPHPEFAREGWWASLDVILEEAQRLDMKVWLLDDQHFPTGYAAGAVENAPKELCHRYLDYNTLESWGPRPQMEIDVDAWARPQPLPPWMPPLPGEPKRKHRDDRLLRVLACPVEEGGKLGAPLDLTTQVADGRLIWDVPEGYWKIFVVYLTYDARGRNDYINFLDEDSCRLQIDAVYEPHYERYGALFGSVIAGFFSDEPPIGNTPGYTRGDLIGRPDMSLSWSKRMPQAIEREFGEGWELCTPFLWQQGSDGQMTARIRTAYMNAVSRLVSECFSNQLGRWCEDHGVEYIGHMLEDCDASASLGPSMGHFFRGLSGQHMAGIDNIGGQVLPGGADVRRHEPDACQDSAGFYHYMLGRMGASMAAVDPKKKGRCMCENFGAYGWNTGVRLEKYLTDHFLARGVNRFVPHAFSPKAFPDPDCPPHFYAHGENPQFRAFGALMAYTNRICHLIDGGIAEAPVALLYHGESQWAGAYESNILACRQLSQSQISFLLIPADVLAEGRPDSARFDGAAKTLDVNGVSCRALVISGCQYLTRDAAEFAVRAKTAGFPVIFTGRVAEGVSDVTAEESRRLAAALADCRVVAVERLAEEFHAREFRTVIPEKSWKHLTAYHYRNGQEVYLVLNEDVSRTFRQWVTLRGRKDVCVYGAWENRIRRAPVRENGGSTEVYLELAPLEMAVLLCGAPGEPVVPEEILQASGNSGGGRTELRLPEQAAGQVTESADAVQRADGKAAGQLRAVQAMELETWMVSRCEAAAYPNFSEAEPADLRHGMARRHPEFSGFYRYETEAELTGTAYARLEIEDAYESAEVFVNGVSAGMRTALPYRYELDGLLKNGKNTIVIEVATTLERKARAIGAGDGGMGAPVPLSPTGIVGKVRLMW